MLWWANRFYWVLIPGCFGFFGLHSLLWFWRSRKDAATTPTPADRRSPMRRTPPRRGAHPPLRSPTRLLHVVVMMTFLGLSATGLPLLFSDAPWSRVLAALFGGFHGAGLVHRVLRRDAARSPSSGTSANVCWRAFVRGERGLFWGPDVDGAAAARRRAALPADPVVLRRGPAAALRALHLLGEVRLLGRALGHGADGRGRPGALVPGAASRVLPGWMFNVALFVHGAEATLAIGFIFVIHFFNGHLRPGKFPMDLVIFTGSVSDDELREERAGRVRAAGRDRRAGRAGRPAAVGRRCRRRGRLIGTAGLTIGLALVALILYAVLR